MKTNMKRFLSVLLAALMLCGMLAVVPVSAAETLTVNVESNFFQSSQTSETTFTVNGETFVYVDFKMYAQDKLLVNADIRGLEYDPEVLEWDKDYNQIGEGRDAKINFFAAADELGIDSVVRKTGEGGEGRIIGNFSSVTTPIPAYGENNKPITVVTAVFKVKNPTAALNGTTQVKCNVKYLALCDEENKASPYTQYQIVNDYNVNSEFASSISTSSKVEGKLFNGQSISLEGDIAVNFYLNLTAEEIKQGVKVDFSWFDKFGYVVLSSDDFISSNKGYKATCNVAPAEMKYPITVKVSVNGEEKHQTLKYSVCDYADIILSGTYQADTQLVDLVRKMLDYGTRAQEAFDRTDAGLANAAYGDCLSYTNLGYQEVLDNLTLKLKHTNMDKLTDYGLEYYNSTIVYLTKVTIRHYYTVTDWDKFNAFASGVKFGGKSVNFKKSGSMVYFDYAGVDAVDSPRPFVLQIGDYSFSYSVYDYIYLCLSSNMKEATKKLVTAAYYFSESAADYF